MARRFKPIALKVISGSRRVPAGPEPQPVGDLHAAPDWFNESQKAGWDYAIENAPRGLLKLLDRSILTVWVIAESMHREAVLKVNRHGLLIKGPDDTPQQSPFLAIAAKQALVMLRAGALLGFSPSARAGIAAGGSGGGPSFANNGVRPPAA